MEIINKRMLILGTLLLGVPFVLDISYLLKLVVTLVGGQIFYYGLEAHKDMFYVLYRKNLGKAQQLGIGREKLYTKCLRAFQEISISEKYLFAYSVSPNRNKNCSWVVFLCLSMTFMSTPLPEVTVSNYVIRKDVQQVLPVPIECSNQRVINVAVDLGKKLFKTDSVDYELMYGDICECGYCKPSNLYYGIGENNLSTLYVFADSSDMLVILDSDTGLIERVEQTVIRQGEIVECILYERESLKEGITKSLDAIQLEGGH